MVSLADCANVLIQGVTLRNSAGGIFSPNHCQNLIVRDATFLNEWYAQNGDGLDIANCRGVAVYRCTLSTGDDAICMKAEGKSPFPGEAGLQEVVVAECTVYHGHGGFVVGGTTESGMANLWCTQCVLRRHRHRDPREERPGARRPGPRRDRRPRLHARHRRRRDRLQHLLRQHPRSATRR